MADAKPTSASDIVGGDAMGKQHDAGPSDFSILHRMIPHLDRHLVYPLIGFLKESYEDGDAPEDLQKLEYELLKTTNMHDYVGDLYAKMNGLNEPPSEYAQRREDVMSKTATYQESCATLLDLLADANVTNNLRADKVANLNYLRENHGVTPEMVTALYDFGQFQYTYGDYAGAGELLYQFRILVCAFMVQGKHRGALWLTLNFRAQTPTKYPLPPGES